MPSLAAWLSQLPSAPPPNRAKRPLDGAGQSTWNTTSEASGDGTENKRLLS